MSDTARDSRPEVSPDATARAKHLPLGPPIVTEPPRLVPARMINELFYCERLMVLEWAHGEFADNEFTVEGRAVHKRADRPGGALPPPPASDDDPAAAPPPDKPYQARAVWLSSERLGLTAKIDVVEAEGGKVLPIEYKRGKRPDVPEGAYLPERAQLCVQVLLLREHGYECDEAAIYFAGDHQRVPIAIDEGLIDAVLAAVGRAKALTSVPGLPPPLVDSPKCNGCSLVGICLPDEVNLLRRLEGAEQPEPPAPEPADGGPEPDSPELDEEEDADVVELRRLHPARDDKLPLYVQEQGAFIGLDGDELKVRSRDGKTLRARLPNTSQVCLLGNVQISTQATRALLDRGTSLSYFSYGGWYLGRLVGNDSKNVELRLAQYRQASDPGFCLSLAHSFVAAKILNARTMLRRNHRAPDPTTLFSLKQLARKAREAPSIESLLGIEGTAARMYFADFTGMLKGAAAEGAAFDLEGRNRRPPKDPINALLSFTYALLSKDFVIALNAAGLDPLLGFYHQPRFGRPALALDLMEEFRHLVADSVVLAVLNNGIVGPNDFLRGATGVALKSPARRALIQAYERRVDQLVTHPVFGYRISYRRVLEVQARLLGRHLLGEIDRYPSFRTR